MSHQNHVHHTRNVTRNICKPATAFCRQHLIIISNTSSSCVTMVTHVNICPWSEFI